MKDYGTKKNYPQSLKCIMDSTWYMWPLTNCMKRGYIIHTFLSILYHYIFIKCKSINFTLQYLYLPIMSATLFLSKGGLLNPSFLAPVRDEPSKPSLPNTATSKSDVSLPTSRWLQFERALLLSVTCGPSWTFESNRERKIKI